MNDGKKLVLFDFDGVIADTYGFTWELAQQIYPGITPDEHLTFFEGNIHEATSKRNEERTIDYWGMYVPRLMNSPLFPGIVDVIQALSRSYVLSVVSSSMSVPIREYLTAQGLAQYFDDVLGGDVHKRKVEKINMTLEKHSAAPDDAVFVTDTLGDMREAAACDVGSIAVSYGFHQIGRLKHGNPFKIVDSAVELQEAIEQYFNHAKRD